MPYPEDLVGKYINVRLKTTTGNMDGSLLNGVLPNQTEQFTVAVFSERPPPKTHKPQRDLVWIVNTNQPLTYTWLTYAAGYVTTAPVAGPVMTGPMSGCLLCRYNLGGQKLAHIGTVHNSQSPDTKKVKLAWLDFVDKQGISNSVTGISPLDCFSAMEVGGAMTSGGGVPNIVGYFTSTQAYAMLLAPVRKDRIPLMDNPQKVAAVKRMDLKPWTILTHKFIVSTLF